MDEVKVTIGRAGRISLPARLRRSVGLREGDEVVVGVVDGALRVESRDAAIGRVQRRVRERLGGPGEADGAGRLLSEELIAERRAEAQREEAEVGSLGSAGAPPGTARGQSPEGAGVG